MITLGIFLNHQKKNIQKNYSDKMENFHTNFYNMEQVMMNHTKMFEDYTSCKNNLIKQKEKLFLRGKPSEWQMKQVSNEPDFFNKLMEDKKKAFGLMLDEVDHLLGFSFS